MPLLLTLALCGCVAEVGLLHEGWTRLPPRALKEPRPAVATPDLRAESRLIDVPPPPDTVPFVKRRERALTLGQATLLALKHNRRIRIIEFDPQIAAQQPVLADASFDPRFGAGGSFARTDQPAASELESLGGGNQLEVSSFGVPPGLPNLLSLDKRLRSGGAASASYGFTYDLVDTGGEFLNLNPAWRTTFTVSLEQPLVQGRGREVNELDIRIAKTNAKQSEHEFKRVVQELLRDVQLGYWNLVHAQLSHETMLRSVAAGDQTRERLVQQFQLGRAALQDLAQGVLYSESLNGELAKSFANVQDAEQQLRVLLGLPVDDGTRIKPTEQLITDDFLPDWQRGVTHAFEHRADLKSQAERVRSARLALRQSTEVLRPDVDAFATVGYTGLDDNLPQATDELWSTDYTNWSVGLRYQRTLSQRAEKATHRLAEISLAREKATLTAIEATVMHELRDAYRRVHVALATIRPHRSRLEAAREFVASRKEMYEVGVAVLEDLLDAEGLAVEAETELLISLTEYNQAIVSWQFATANIGKPPLGSLREPTTGSDEAMELLRNKPAPPSFEPIDDSQLPDVDLRNLEELVPPIPNVTPERSATPPSPPERISSDDWSTTPDAASPQTVERTPPPSGPVRR